MKTQLLIIAAFALSFSAGLSHAETNLPLTTKAGLPAATGVNPQTAADAAKAAVPAEAKTVAETADKLKKAMPDTPAATEDKAPSTLKDMVPSETPDANAAEEGMGKAKDAGKTPEPAKHTTKKHAADKPKKSATH